MEPRLDLVHVEIDTGLILMRMAGVVHETELFKCSQRIRNLAEKVHNRATHRFEELPHHVLTATEREALLEKIGQLKQSLDQFGRVSASTKKSGA